MTDDATKVATRNPNNYFFLLSENKFIYMPTRSLIEAPAVRRQIGDNAARTIEENRTASNLTWAPGKPTFIQDTAIIDEAWIDFAGNNLLNTYRAAMPSKSGNADLAGPWLEAGQMLWGDDLPHLLDWLAFKVQHPEVKINHCLVLGSRVHGLGKDSWLAGTLRAIGRHNWKNVGASMALAYAEKNYTASLLRKSVLRISEAHDLGPARFKFYDLTKDWCAAPPETLTVADKNVKPHEIANVVGVIYTTNHKTDALHIDKEDRRHFVAWSELAEDDIPANFWDKYWHWLGFNPDGTRRILKDGEVNGDEHVAAFLKSRDLSNFSAFQRPPHTDAWHSMVSAGAEPQDAPLLDVLDHMGEDYMAFAFPSRPDAVTMNQIARQAGCEGKRELADLFNSVKSRRTAAHRLDDARYTAVPNPDAANGLWRINGVRTTVYARADLPKDQQRDAVRAMIGQEESSAPISDAAADFAEG